MDYFILNVQKRSGKFERRVPISFDNGRYLLKTVDDFDELKLALRLRYEVFFSRGMGKNLRNGLDVDRYDQDSDHLVVIEKETGQIVGNYRIRCSKFHPQFYSENEFILDDLFELACDNKIEIGRACIHPDHRNGSVIQLLWRGLLAYMRATEARYLFGCSSVSTQNSGQIEYVWNYLKKNNLFHPEIRVEPRHPYVFRTSWDEDELSEGFPPLLLSYIRSGAKVLGPPAFDPEFECADFFTLLDLNNLARKRARHYESELQQAVV
jgi:putative hemolysin